jgi:PST family polysaccharide transporter
MTEAASSATAPWSASRSFAWNVGASSASQGLHLLLRLVLARLLTPGEFGLVALAMAVVSFTWWAQDLSLAPALIQRRTLSAVEKSTAFWTAVFAGCVIFLALVGLAPVIAAFFRAEALVPILRAVAFSIVLASPETTLGALLKREYRFKAVAVRQVGGVVLGGGTGIVLALMGFGAWSLVGDVVVRASAGSALLWLQSPWKPSFVFSGRALAELWGFSRSLVGARLLNTLNRNVDTVLVGRFLGAGAVGVYNLGYQFVLLPLTHFSRAVNEVLFVRLSQLQDDPAGFAAAYARTVQLQTLVTFPLMTIIALAAPVLVPALLGSGWADAVPLLPFMCLAGAIQSMHALISGVLQARARTNLHFVWVLASAVATTIAIACGVAWGLRGVAVAYATATVGMSLVVMPAVFRGLGLPMVELATLTGKPAASCLAIVAVWKIVALLAAGAGARHPLVLTIAQGAAGALAYLALCLRLHPQLLSLMRGIAHSPQPR